jgi:hypothetical protein
MESAADKRLYESRATLAFAHRVLIAKCPVVGVLAVLMFIWHAADLPVGLRKCARLELTAHLHPLHSSEYFLRQNCIAGARKLKSRLENKSR